MQRGVATGPIPKKNLAVELLQRLLEGEIKSRFAGVRLAMLRVAIITFPW